MVEAEEDSPEEDDALSWMKNAPRRDAETKKIKPSVLLLVGDDLPIASFFRTDTPNEPMVAQERDVVLNGGLAQAKSNHELRLGKVGVIAKQFEHFSLGIVQFYPHFIPRFIPHFIPHIAFRGCQEIKRNCNADGIF